MAYQLFKGRRRWQAFGDKPTISILTTGLICFNQVCYETFVKPAGCQYVKLYYDAEEAKKIAFELIPGRKIGEFVLPIKLIKTGRLAIIRAKTFLEQVGIKYKDQSRSFPVYQTPIYESSPGYKPKWRDVVRVIEIHLDECIKDEQ